MNDIIILKIVTEIIPQNFILYTSLFCMIGFVFSVFATMLTEAAEKIYHWIFSICSIALVVSIGLFFTPIGQKEQTTYYVYFPNPQIISLYEKDYNIQQDQNIYILIPKDTRNDWLKDTS